MDGFGVRPQRAFLHPAIELKSKLNSGQKGNQLFCAQAGSSSLLPCGTLPIAKIIVKILYKFGAIGVYGVKP